MINLICNTEKLNRVLQSENVYLYGGGTVATHVADYALDYGFHISGVLVTDQKENEENLFGIKIRQFDRSDILNIGMIIVCTRENLHKEIDNNLGNIPDEKKWYISDKLFMELKHGLTGYGLKNKSCIEQMKNEITYGYQRFIQRPCYELLVVDILDHCNLKCKGCDHFACIADPYFVPFESVKSDIERIGKVFKGDYIMQFGVMGGEPLLHPDLVNILNVIRDNFPNARISVYTNGLLLKNQKEDFWEGLRKNNVGIMHTRYPISLDFDGIAEKARNENVTYDYYQFNGEKELFKKVINLKGSGDPVESFAKCHISNYGNFLMEGKIYGCPFSCLSNRIFNAKFNQHLRMTERDYIDIYKEDDMENYFKFAAKPKFYCRYCDGVRYGIPWSRTKGEMEEWVEEVRIKE